MVRKILLLLLVILPLFLLVALTNSAFATTDSSSANSTTTQTIYTIPIGAYGCSFKNDPPKYTPVIPCGDSGICYPDQEKITYNLQTSTFENGLCISTNNKCPVCTNGYEYYLSTGKCVNENNVQDQQSPIRTDPCQQDQACSPGFGCEGANGSAVTLSTCPNGICHTALGDLPTNLSALLTKVFSIALSIAGVVALGLIIASGYRLMISQGNPEQVKGAREQLTAAIVGLLFIIFSLVILQVIGVNILNIPGFG